MKNKTLLFLFLFAFILSLNSCVTLKPFYYGSYDISLTEVERPAEATQRYGEQKISSATEEGNQNTILKMK
ncbi:MAG: hypothetical protein DRQ13_07515 [Ignavibacteriae bacterium]|nr:MAG: hypothetical protein DRQ13_07515 [Ignavibacteriota bacterium]